MEKEELKEARGGGVITVACLFPTQKESVQISHGDFACMLGDAKSKGCGRRGLKQEGDKKVSFFFLYEGDGGGCFAQRWRS